MRNYLLSTWVILSGAKDLTLASLITVRIQRDANFVGEVPHFVRDEPRSTRHRALFTSYA
jgi:hypothetical protein